jgi:hypothetical protein
MAFGTVISGAPKAGFWCNPLVVGRVDHRAVTVIRFLRTLAGDVMNPSSPALQVGEKSRIAAQ